MKKHVISSFLVGAAAFVFLGCASVQKYSQISGQFPQVDAGQGRIFFYRGSEFSWGRAGVNTKITLNDQGLETLKTGCFFYVDRPAGDYFVGCRTGLLDPGQGKHKLTFTLGADETKYIRITEHWGVVTADAEPTLEDKDSAIKTLTDCAYTPLKK